MHFSRIRGLIVVAFIGGVASLLVFGGLFLSGVLSQADAVEVTEDFFVAARDQHVDRSYAHTSKQFQQFASRDDLAFFLAQQPVFVDSTLTDVVLLNKVKARATVYSVATREEETFPVLFAFVKEGRDWKIESISVDPADMPVVKEVGRE